MIHFHINIDCCYNETLKFVALSALEDFKNMFRIVIIFSTAIFLISSDVLENIAKKTGIFQMRIKCIFFNAFKKISLKFSSKKLLMRLIKSKNVLSSFSFCFNV